MFRKLFYFDFNQIKKQDIPPIDNQLFLNNTQNFPAYSSIQIIDNTVVLILDQNQINPSFELKKQLITQAKFITKIEQYQVFYNQKHRSLLLQKNNCTVNDQLNSLFLQLYPKNINFVTSYNKAIFKNYNYELFNFSTVGQIKNQVCLYGLKLPQYEMIRIVLGQNNKDLKWDKSIWKIELELSKIINELKQ